MAGWFVLVLLLLPSVEVRALDGWFDVRANRQQGRAGASAFTTRALQTEGRVEERLDFSRALYLQVRYGALREGNWGEFGGLRTDYETVTQQPGTVLGLRAGDLRLGLSANGYRRDYFGQGYSGRRDDRLEYGGWAQYERGSLRLNGRWLDAENWQEDRLGANASRTRARTVGAGARLALWRDGDLSYTYADNDHRDLDRASRTRFLTHALQHRGGLSLGGRGRVSWDAQTQRFTHNLGGPLTGGRQYLSPLGGGYRLDDTPEIEDPLEGSLIGVSALFDNDRTTATSINIGDAASVVREFGGDYRNVRYDFGAAREVSMVLLYVDRVLAFPRLITWRFFVSDDPEGRLWQPVEPAAVSWREWSPTERGWEVRFSAPISTRFLKMVDVKSGPTVPDLFVTELEVYDDSPAVSAETHEVSWRHRLDTEVTYQVAREWQLRWTANVDERRFGERAKNLSGLGQRAQARWTRAVWSSGVSFETQRLRNAARGDTDVRRWGANVSRGLGTDLVTALSWNRQDDHSRAQPRTTDNWALQGDWEALPGLRVTERLTYGRVADTAYGGDSRAWVVTGAVRSTPRGNLGVDLTHTRRWVSQEAGSGFTPYNDTESSVRWSPWPLLSISSQVRYQVRESSEWLLRHLAAWTPAPGGSVDIQVSLDAFRDTGGDLSQEGGGATVVWRARPRLTLEAGIEKTRFAQRGAQSWPLGGSARANWTF